MIGIIFVGDLIYCPYINKYLKVLKNHQKDYEVLFWNRENNSNKYPENYICFNKKSELNRRPVNKIIDFLQFGVWLKKIIAAKKYNKLIVLSTLSGIFIISTLLKSYKRKYIFDIRDYSYEKYNLFYKLEEQIIRYSRFTCISSPGFTEFLPKKFDYVMAHNFNYNDVELGRNFKKKKYGSVINLIWNGTIRYFNCQSEIIDRLKNDTRFNIVYHGCGPDLDRLKRYCEAERICNVSFTGTYDNTTKACLLENADILNNCYGSKNINEILYAISNKYYDGLIYGIPQLVEINSFKHKKVSELGVGIGLDVLNKDFADRLYNYYFSIDEEIFNKSCIRELNNVIEEDQIYLNSIREFVIK